MIFVQGFRVTLSASGVKRHPKAEKDPKDGTHKKNMDFDNI